MSKSQSFGVGLNGAVEPDPRPGDLVRGVAELLGDRRRRPRPRSPRRSPACRRRTTARRPACRWRSSACRRRWSAGSPWRRGPRSRWPTPRRRRAGRGPGLAVVVVGGRAGGGQGATATRTARCRRERRASWRDRRHRRSAGHRGAVIRWRLRASRAPGVARYRGASWGRGADRVPRSRGRSRCSRARPRFTRAGRLGVPPREPAGAPVARVVVDVMLKPEILDPQGQAVPGACRGWASTASPTSARASASSSRSTARSPRSGSPRSRSSPRRCWPTR